MYFCMSASLKIQHSENLLQEHSGCTITTAPKNVDSYLARVVQSTTAFLQLNDNKNDFTEQFFNFWLRYNVKFRPFILHSFKSIRIYIIYCQIIVSFSFWYFAHGNFWNLFKRDWWKRTYQIEMFSSSYFSVLVYYFLQAFLFIRIHSKIRKFRSIKSAEKCRPLKLKVNNCTTWVYCVRNNAINAWNFNYYNKLYNPKRFGLSRVATMTAQVEKCSTTYTLYSL